jgi:hypothetical protein
MGSADRDRVRALDELGVLDTPPEERFDRITRIARELFGVDSALVSLIGDDRQWVKSPQVPGAGSAPRVDALCDTAIRTPDTLVVPDATADPRFAENPYVRDGLRFYAGHPLEAPGGFRVGTLCLLADRPRAFTGRERARLEQLARWAQDELTDRAELERAAEVQRGLQPHATTIRVPGFDLAGVCLASRAVGGDLLDWYTADGGAVVVTLGDAMGKGAGAAIMMAAVRAALRTAALQHAPAAALREAAAALEEDLQRTGTFVTVSQLRLAPDAGRVAVADAGHGLTAVVRADGTVTPAAPGGLPLGVLPDGGWSDQHDVLHPGDALVSFSDGLLDLHDGTVDTTVAELARTVRGCGDARSVVDRVAATARRSVLPDDVTVVVLRRLAAA